MYFFSCLIATGMLEEVVVMIYNNEARSLKTAGLVYSSDVGFGLKRYFECKPFGCSAKPVFPRPTPTRLRSS